MLSSVVSFAGNMSTRIAGFTINTATSLPVIILSICFTVMGTFYFSYDRERISGYFKRSVPEKVLMHFRLIKNGVFTAIFGQVRAQIFISFVLMLIIMAGLLIMHKPYALLLGFLIGVADVLPVIGAGLFLNTWAIVSLVLGDYYTAVGMVLLYLVVLTVRQIIEPRIVGKQLGLYPLVTMMSMFAGFKISGAPGLLVGPLVANICKVVLDADAGQLDREKKPAWYTQYLSDNRLTSVTPPDGGVTISILGIPYDKAPFTETMWQGTRNVKTFYWFDLAGYNLTLITPTDDSYSWYNVYRNTEK